VTADRGQTRTTAGSRTAGTGRCARIGCWALGLLLSLGLLGVSSASAAYEQVASFAQGHEEFAQGHLGDAFLTTTVAMAVNRTGAGGVPAGTLYSISRVHASVVSFGPRGDLREAWGWGVGQDGGGGGFQRCGPFGEPEYPKCLSGGGGGTGKGQLAGPTGVAVDQATGNVYVLNSAGPGRPHDVIQVFSADGSELITSFGDAAGFQEKTSESPTNLHEGAFGGIAVDDSGTVFVSDVNNAHPGEARVMLFKPQSPGDFQHYVYSSSDDITGAGVDHFTPGALALDDAGVLYVGNESEIFSFNPSEPVNPTCKFHLSAGGFQGMTVDPESGDPYYYSFKNRKIHQLACDAEGEFVEVGSIPVEPKTEEVLGLAVNPGFPYDSSRPPGVLYAIDGEFHPGKEPSENVVGVGHIFAHPEVRLPRVESESVTSITSSTATLGAQINPEGSQTDYVFQYLTQAQYEANEPNERQALTVDADGGNFGLAFEGHGFGGAATATLSSGSAAATGLRTATGTATLSAAKGTGTLKAASGKGTVILNSTTVSGVTTSAGAFEVGQEISSTGIPPNTTILAIKPESAEAAELTISNAATKSGVHVSLSAGSKTVTAVSTGEGAFAVGQQVSGPGISAGAKITAVSGAELTLSQPASQAGVGVELSAGSTTLTGVSASQDAFEVGERVEGPGIPPGATVLSVDEGTLGISKAATASGTVAIFSPGPSPLAVGQQVTGPGIPAGTTIAAVEAGQLTLSAPATASGTVTLHGGLPFDASPGRLKSALESLAPIGAGNVKVSGGPGDEGGTSPYEIEFIGDLEDVDVAQLVAEGGGLSGGAASVTVDTGHEGGGGFDEDAAEAPPGGAQVGEGNEPLAASASLLGLQPDTTYRFRAVASSHCDPSDEAKVCEGVGADMSFRTFPAEAPELPDHRAWELVSPTQKNGGEAFSLFPERGSCANAIECKPGAAAEKYPMQSAPDGEAIVYEGQPFSLTEGANVYNEYLSKRTPSGWQTTVLAPRLLGTNSVGYKAFNASLSEGVIYQTSPTLSPEAPSEMPNLYAQPTTSPATLNPFLESTFNRSSDLKLSYAGASADFSRQFFAANDALTVETPFAPEAEVGGVNEYNLYEKAGGEMHLVNVLPGNAATAPGAFFGGPGAGIENLTHAISEDGSRVFWSDKAGQVYVRVNGESTIEIPDSAGFLSASADGSKVLLRDGHIYDLETEASADLTEGHGGFQGLVGQGEDLSSIYFVDTAVLTGEEESEHGAKAQAGKDNLYSWKGGSPTFVATLVAADDNIPFTGGDWHFSASERTAQASPDGRWLTFLSKAPLTGYDSVGPACEQNSVGELLTVPCREVFLYDSAAGKLRCLSCNPGNERPLGPSILPIGKANSFPQPRYMFDSGRVYFDTQDSLSPFDTNGRGEDVYQYEPSGVGSCKRDDGCLNLITAGHEPDDSNFLAADAAGRNVFFTSRDQLVLKDKDELFDVYDAREDGGIPSETETARSECQGEACQTPVSPPNDPTPGSSTFAGAGNVSEPKATKKKHKKKRHSKKHNKRAAKHNRGGAR
jgi:hypothetical protein